MISQIANSAEDTYIGKHYQLGVKDPLNDELINMDNFNSWKQ